MEKNRTCKHRAFGALPTLSQHHGEAVVHVAQEGSERHHARHSAHHRQQRQCRPDRCVRDASSHAAHGGHDIEHTEKRQQSGTRLLPNMLRPAAVAARAAAGGRPRARPPHTGVCTALCCPCCRKTVVEQMLKFPPERLYGGSGSNVRARSQTQQARHTDPPSAARRSICQ